MSDTKPSGLFSVHILNEGGKAKARRIAGAFETLLSALEAECGPSGREFAVVRTKLEEAAFFAKKSMAQRTENQEP